MDSLESAKQHLNELFTAAAKFSPISDIAQDEEHPLWQFTTDSGSFIIVEWNQELKRLMLTIEILPVPEHERESMFAQALHYNLLWQETGGARMALMPQSQSLQLMIDLHPEQLDAHLLANVVTNLLHQVHDWQLAIHNETAPTTGLDDDDTQKHIIRG